MSTDAIPGYHGADLLRAAAAAAERAPQLADEIRAHATRLAARVSAGHEVNALDVDTRTLISLIEQSGVQLQMHRRRPAETTG